LVLILAPMPLSPKGAREEGFSILCCDPDFCRDISDAAIPLVNRLC
jgi:hypothetical protein